MSRPWALPPIVDVPAVGQPALDHCTVDRGPVYLTVTHSDVSSGSI